MRIFQVARRMAPKEWGGVEEYALNLVGEQRRRGDESSILATKALCDGDISLSNYVKYFDYQYPFLLLNSKQRLELDRFGGDPISPSMKNFILENECDVLHLHTTSRLITPLIRALHRKAKIVMTLQSGTYVENLKIKVTSKSSLPYGRIIDTLYSRKDTLKKIDAFHCYNEPDFNFVRKKYPSAIAKIIPPFANPIFFERNDTPREVICDRIGLSSKLPIFAIAGRIHPIKNQLNVVRALKNISEAQLCIYGPVGDESYANQITQFIKNENLLDRIKILPAMKSGDRDRVRILHAVNFLLLPSVYDSFGIVVLEAWAAGCPVAATPLDQWDSSGDKNKPIYNGDFSSAEASENTLRKLLMLSENEKESVAQRAKELALTSHTLKYHAEEIQKLYSARN